MKLVDNAKNWYRMASVQVAAFWGVWGLLTADQQASILTLLHVPQDKVPAIIAITFIVARLVAQKGVSAPPPGP